MTVAQTAVAEAVAGWLTEAKVARAAQSITDTEIMSKAEEYLKELEEMANPNYEDIEGSDETHVHETILEGDGTNIFLQ